MLSPLCSTRCHGNRHTGASARRYLEILPACTSREAHRDEAIAAAPAPRSAPLVLGEVYQDPGTLNIHAIHFSHSVFLRRSDRQRSHGCQVGRRASRHLSAAHRRVRRSARWRGDAATGLRRTLTASSRRSNSTNPNWPLIVTSRTFPHLRSARGSTAGGYHNPCGPELPRGRAARKATRDGRHGAWQGSGRGRGGDRPNSYSRSDSRTREARFPTYKRVPGMLARDKNKNLCIRVLEFVRSPVTYPFITWRMAHAFLGSTHPLRRAR